MKMYEQFWFHIFIMFLFLFFIFYPSFMESKHMTCILIGHYICVSCLYFLIGICACVVIDIIYLFINVIQVGKCCIYIILLYKIIILYFVIIMD